ncbi:MAG: winged helix-turn-helix domain-containing protein [Nitrososphaerota archaeon]
MDEEIRTTSVDPKDLDSTIELFKIISSKTRYDVLRELAKDTRCFTELHTALGYSQKTIAQCLDDLLKIKAISRVGRGYSLSPLGKLILLQLKELSALLKKVREVEDMDFEFEF